MKDISVQSSVSLQHLPYDTAAEAGNFDAALLKRLSFAKQKLGEIVGAAQDAGAAGGNGRDTTVPKPGAQHYA